MNEAESMILNSTCCTCINSSLEIRTHRDRGTWLARSVEHTTLDLGVVSSSPALGAEIPFFFFFFFSPPPPLKIVLIYLADRGHK